MLGSSRSGGPSRWSLLFTSWLLAGPGCSLISLDDLQSGGGGAASTTRESSTTGGPNVADVTVSVASSACISGARSRVDLVVENQGTAPAQSVSLSFTVAPPTSLEATSGSACQVGGAAGVCDLGPLDPAGSVTITLDLAVDAATTSIPVAANVSTGSEESDTANNQLGSTPACAPGVLKTALGQGWSCALLTDQSLRCWGRNHAGQLGDGELDPVNAVGDAPSEMDHLAALDLDPQMPDRSVVDLAAGFGHACAIIGDGVVKCWGDNDHGQLGQETLSAGEPTPSLLNPVALGGKAQLISAGDDFTCVILQSGTMKCWGASGLGQLGLGSSNDRGDDPGEMGAALPPVPLGGPAKAVCAGNRFGCALLTSGVVKCWGANDQGQLGADLPDTAVVGDAPGETPVAVAVGTADSIACGVDHACARSQAGHVRCWGRNSGGQLGQGNTINYGVAGANAMAGLADVDLGEGRTALEIAAGGFQSCALLDDHTVKCWGPSPLGTLGQGATQGIGNGPGEMGNALLPIDLGTGFQATHIALSHGGLLPRATTSPTATHVCATTTLFGLKCWGANTRGELGLGDTEPRGDGPGEMGDALPWVTFGAP